MTVWTFQKQLESQLVNHRRSPLHTPRSSPLEYSTVPAADGIKKWNQTRLGKILIFNFPRPTANTGKFMGETAAASGYVNSDVAQSEEDLTESLGVFSNLSSVTASYIGVVETLTDANARLA